MDSSTKDMIKAVCKVADANGNVSKGELHTVLKILGMDVDSILKELPLSNGSISIDDFLDYSYSKMKIPIPDKVEEKKAPTETAKANTKEMIKAKFKRAGNGMISQSELQAVLKNLGMDGAELNSVFKNLDLSKGSVSIDDFIDWTYGEKKKSAAEPVEHPSLGIVRLDYDYPPAPGDIDHSGSFTYDVYYRAVPGLTFDVCQSGKIPPEVEKEFIEAIKWLCAKGVKGISGDCGFMMWFQALARKHTKKPVFMSSLAHLPAITCAFANFELIAIFTANSQTLKPMKALIKDECGVDPDERRYIIVGCEDVPGFEAVELGQKVDTVKVTPGIVKKVQDTLKAHPTIRAILMECTELPAYSDAVRAATGLPVFDAITCA